MPWAANAFGKDFASRSERSSEGVVDDIRFASGPAE
jgi:hypothetical protein